MIGIQLTMIFQNDLTILQQTFPTRNDVHENGPTINKQKSGHQPNKQHILLNAQKL